MKLKTSTLKTYLIVVSLALLSGCAHNIQLNPDLNKLREVESKTTIDKNVAYYISAEDREKSVTTPGGGGDKVTYKPYPDSEAALNTVLSKIFSRVYSLASIDDESYINEKNVSFIFIPKIETNSASSSLFTWPPTEFTINLSCKALDAQGNIVWEKNLQSEGSAEYGEFKSDFSLAARRASESIFTQLLEEIAKDEKNFK